MEYTTIKRSARAEQSNWRRAQTKGVMLRLAIFVLVLFTTHSLALWLHPLGPHRFFWNLSLGGLTFAVIVSLLRSHLKGTPPQAENHQLTHHKL